MHAILYLIYVLIIEGEYVKWLFC